MNEMSRIPAPSGERYQARFTTAEFLHMCEVGAFEDIKVELVDGEIERLNLPKTEHGRLQAVLMFELMRVLGRDAIDRVRAEVGIDLGNDTVLGGDVTLLRHAVVERRWLRSDDVLLLIEISDATLGRDMGLKLPRYAEAGLANYWVVDAKRALVHLHGSPADRDYTRVTTARFGEPIPVPGTDATVTLL